MPVYNGSEVIEQTLKSVLGQSFTNFDLIIVDDCSKDETERVVKNFKDRRIKFFKNEKNLGYAKNLEECRKKAGGDIVYLMGQDDILAKGALENTHRVFLLDEDVGAVTRPYYWFDKEITVPVRAKKQLNPQKDEVVTINDAYSRIIRMFSTLDQLSGLAYRRKYLDTPFHPDIFPCHVYPFASIFKKHKVIFLKDYNVAVRMVSSQTRSVFWIYNKSPVQSWVDMFEGVFKEKRWRLFRRYMIENFVATNYVGLIQIRNYARYRFLIREILMLLKYRPKNFFSFQFWFFSLGCLLTPAYFLIPLVNWYKNRIYARRLTKIKWN
jgi:glycosyltransferase involved in cell wall biosynthesis